MAALFELGVRGAANALRNGELTAEALAEALVARCAASPLNTFISLEADHLRAAARSADQRRRRGERLGPLHGVPLALKQHQYGRFSDHRRNARARGASPETQRADRAALARCRRHRV